MLVVRARRPAARVVARTPLPLTGAQGGPAPVPPKPRPRALAHAASSSVLARAPLGHLSVLLRHEPNGATADTAASSLFFQPWTPATAFGKVRCPRRARGRVALPAMRPCKSLRMRRARSRARSNRAAPMRSGRTPIRPRPYAHRRPTSAPDLGDSSSGAEAKRSERRFARPRLRAGADARQRWGVRERAWMSCSWSWGPFTGRNRRAPPRGTAKQ